MTGFEHTVFTTRSGSIVGTGFGCPRCFRVLDRSGSDVTREPRVDLRTAFTLLAQRAGARSGPSARRFWDAESTQPPAGAGPDGPAAIR